MVMKKRDRGAKDPEETPDLDISDVDRQVRRAVLRGILRTSTNVFLLLVLAGFVVQLVGGAVWAIGGRSGRYSDLITTAVTVAHPEYRLWGSGCCGTKLSGLTIGPLDLIRLSPNPVDTNVEIVPHLNWAEHLDWRSVDLPQTALGVAIQGPIPKPAAALARLDRLPDNLRVSAVVFFVRPLSQDELEPALRPSLRGLPTSFLPLLFDVPHAAGGGLVRVGWTRDDSGVGGFRTWAAGLSGRDDDILGGFGLPSSDVLKQIAADGRISGVVLNDASVALLRDLASDPMVRAVQPAEAVFDLGLPYVGNSSPCCR